MVSSAEGVIGHVRAVDPRTGEPGEAYPAASVDDVVAAATAAEAVARSPALAAGERRVALLDGIAARLQARSDEIVSIGERETGLPPGRLAVELGRTCGQLSAFARLVEEGSYVEAILDSPDPAAQPVPRPDVRRMLVPIGPVAVFGASNFPLAFSTAGGDTASALAAGCPVLVKGHPSHPGLGVLVAAEIAAAVADAGLPPGTFAHLLSGSFEVGGALVEAAAVRAVAFTGSLRGGRALMDRAAGRPDPIPVFAEMGSLNPIVVTEAALAARGEEIVALVGRAVADFGGQLCTKPGLVFVPAGPSGDAFTSSLAGALAQREPEVLLNESVHAGLFAGLEGLQAEPLTPVGAGDTGFRARPAVYRARAADFGAAEGLDEEHFGPVTIVVTYSSLDEAAAALEAAGGQLAATVHAESSDDVSSLVEACARVAGRVVFDGVPTGVAVTYGMQHGGPWPASSAPSTTSVGMTAIRRFLRPVAYQNAPQALLPAALRDGNPLGIWRRVDGQLTRD